MPRLNRRPHRRRDDDQLGDLLRERLEHGATLFAEEVEVDLAAAWERWGEQITRDWVAQHPGTRPYAWWTEAVERYGPRKQVRPGPDAIGPATWFGIPPLHRGVPASDMYEGQREYLERHGLLETEEQHRLRGAGDLNDPGDHRKWHS